MGQILNTSTILRNANFGARTTSVGLVTVPGISILAARADSAPPLDQGITPTWTNTHKFVSALPRIFLQCSAAPAGQKTWDLRVNTVGQCAIVGDDDAFNAIFGAIVFNPNPNVIVQIPNDTTLSVGASDDISISHDGTDSALRNLTGNLNIIEGATTVGRFDNSATANDTRFMLYDVSAATLVRVSRGAIDSGGVGFRVLRIPN